MSGEYKTVRASDMYVGTSGELRVTEEAQLDRLEKKVDRILELLEGQELSTSVVLDGNTLANDIYRNTKKRQLSTRHP